jgi:F0F1-type ATP synthase epsilon subunit
MTNLNLEIISPQGVIFKSTCYMAVVPLADGETGFMHDHEILVACLRSGKIAIYDEKENIIKTFDVTGGFAEMQNAEKLLILID